MKPTFKARLAEFVIRVFGPLYKWSVKENAEAERKIQRKAIIADGLRRLKAYHERAKSNNLHPDSFAGPVSALVQHCNHLKGGRLRTFFGQDYALLTHTFVDGHLEVKCMKCRNIWKSGDPDFAKMIDLAVNHSTNKPSSSEVPIQARYKQRNKSLGKI